VQVVDEQHQRLVGRELGKERFDHYLRAFGFGQTTALQFPGEAEGIMLALQDYNDTSMGSMPIGNGIAVTAMQMLDVYMTIANGGMTRPPRLLAATVDAEGVVLSMGVLPAEDWKDSNP